MQIVKKYILSLLLFYINQSRGQIKGGLSYSSVATRLITCCLSSVYLYISFQTFHILPFIYRTTKLRKPNLFENILRLREIKIAYSNHFKREIVFKKTFSMKVIKFGLTYAL